MVTATKKQVSSVRRGLRATRVSILTLIQCIVLTVVVTVGLTRMFDSTSAAASVHNMLTSKEPEEKCDRPHDFPDGGDCEALGEMRRPAWACLSEMRESIPDFLKVYANRPHQVNTGGMRIEQSFAFWFMLKKIRPTVVIESGAKRGHGTWLIRHALPTARIISLDPVAPDNRLPGVEYLVGQHFIDFGAVHWASYLSSLEIENTLVFVDDHQNAFKRLFRNNEYGFKHFIIEDNYPYQQGDCQSLKTICETKRRSEWKGIEVDNFSRNNTPLSWENHLKQGHHLKEQLEIYYEFPPLADDRLVAHKFSDGDRISTAVVKNKREFQYLFGDLAAWEFSAYVHIAYAKIK